MGNVEDDSHGHGTTHSLASVMQRAFDTQHSLAFTQRANGLESKTSRKLSPRNARAEEIKRSQKANNASPFGEYSASDHLRGPATTQEKISKHQRQNHSPKHTRFPA
jgi:hypothetical protein